MVSYLNGQSPLNTSKYCVYVNPLKLVQTVNIRRFMGALKCCCDMIYVSTIVINEDINC